MNHYYENALVTLYHGDCLEIIPRLECKVDACVTDPPYQYLKNFRWDLPLDENKLVEALIFILADNSVLAIFGRGTPFYKINTMLADHGLVFKEEIIWNKRQNTSPCHPLHRVHETCAIYAKGKAKIFKRKIPYLEKKQFDIPSILQDIKGIASAINNPVELDAIRDFLADNALSHDIPCTHGTGASQQDGIHNTRRGAATLKSMITPIRRYNEKMPPGQNVTVGTLRDKSRGTGYVQSAMCGMNESSIIECNRDHYNTCHPTQKPVRLFERLIDVVAGDDALILDPFAGSGTTGIAAMQTGRRCILIEQDEQYCETAARRIDEAFKDKKQMQLAI